MSGSASWRTAPSRGFAWMRARRGPVMVAGLVLFFGWMVLRQHHPVYGLTRFFQLDTEFAARALPEIDRYPVYVHRDTGSYDGQFYAQLALRPTLQDPQLATAIDNPAFRARRMLMPWVGWGLGLGEPGRILAVYPWINVGVWLGLGALLLRLFPPRSGLALLAWTGLMFSGGVMTGVRNALTDLPALALITLALLGCERQRPWSGAAALAAATLCRETSVLAGSVFMREGTWRRRIALGLTVALPTLLWFLYVRSHLPTGSGNLRNFGWPFESWGTKWIDTITLLLREPASKFHWAGLGSLIGLSVHPIVIWIYRKERDRWWWLATGYAGLLVILGPPTFAGFPMAAARILLPSHLAFNVLALRRGSWVLLLLGNLSLGTGWIAHTASPLRDHDELFANVAADGAYIGWTGPGWYQVEYDSGGQRWAWCSQEGVLQVRRYPTEAAREQTGRLQFALAGPDGNAVSIYQDDRLLWNGTTSRASELIEVWNIAFDAGGRATLRFVGAGPPMLEGDAATGRRLTFGIFYVEGGRPR